MREIVTEDDMHVVVQYLAQEPHPEALAVKDLSDAEHEQERVCALVYAEQSGTVRDKEMGCNVDSRVGRAKAAVAEAKGNLAEHRARVRRCEMFQRIWDRQHVIIRDAERVR
jgi:hypothetical protein